MYTTPTLGEIRPSVTSGDPNAEPFTIPLLRLRGHDRPVIQPEDCLVRDCLVCQWRRAGLLDRPETRVVREPASVYSCHSSYCPACNTVRCICSPYDADEAHAEQSYVLGYDHGSADGPESRPTTKWLADAGLDAESYKQGYDDACAGLPLGMPAELLPEHPAAPVFWDECDDGLPF